MYKEPSCNKNFNPQNPNPASSWAPYSIYNIGSSSSRSLMEYIEELEYALGRKAKKVFLDMQPGDVPNTEADTSLLEEYVSFKPSTSIEKGIKNFVNWYKKFYKV